MKRFVRVCAGTFALATGVALAPMATATAATSQNTASSAAHWSSQRVTIGAPRLVNLKAVSNAATGQHAAKVPPVRHANRSAAQRAAFQSGAQSSVKTLAPPRLATSVSPTQDFQLMSLDAQFNVFGGDQALEPPDTQVAVGTSDLVEAVNSTLSIWSKTTGTRSALADLNAFFSVPSGFSFSDPRVLYDAPTGLFFLSGWSLNSANDSLTYLAVTSNPGGIWTIYTVRNNSANHTLTDQPMTGVCDDKVVMAWDEFTGTGSAVAYDGAQTLVLQKSVLQAAGTLGNTDSVLSTTADEFRPVPAQALSSSTTCYMTVNNASADIVGSTGTPNLGVYAITGTPEASTVALNETNLPIATTNAPPAPRQPGGVVEPAANNDDALLSAVWQNGQLWTGGTDACTPGGDTAARNCLRLDEVNTSTMTVSQDFDLGTPGMDTYYPAVSLDSSGNLFVAYSASSTSVDPGAFAVISPSGTNSFTAPTTIQAGSTPYGGARWGDYSAAAPDPSVAGAVWVAGEYAATPTVTGLPDWGTAAAELTLPAGFPAINSAAQTTFTEGTGGTFTVTATGTPAPTFTETGAPSWVSLDANTGALTGTPPALSGGNDPIQITATNSVGSVTQTFTLNVNPVGPAYTPVGPVRVMDTRNAIGHSGAVGPNQTITLTLPTSDVPAGATAVVMNVTVTGPTASSFVTVFPAGQARPNASSLNFTAGETIPNLVTVPVGTNGQVSFYNHAGSVSIIADLAGYYSTSSGSFFHSARPLRVLDTRNGIGVSGAVGPGRTIALPVTGIDGVPASATAVVLNVTAVSPTASSFVTVYPEVPNRPNASSLNFTAGETIANLVVVPVNFGSVLLFNHSGSVNLLADLAGYFTAAGGSSFTSTGPTRVLDTRNAIGHSGAVGPNQTITLTFPTNDVPAGATAVVLNVTVTGPTASSFVTVFPAGQARPNASNLNFTAGETIPNLVTVPVGTNGQVSFYNHSGSVNIIADLAGYYIN